MDFSRNVVFVIVTYKVWYTESITYKSLLSSYSNSFLKNGLNILIVDNTDDLHWIKRNHLQEEKTDVFVSYENHKNIGISKAYNKAGEFAKNNDFEWIVFLDQDTILPLCFYDKYLNAIAKGLSSSFIKLPIIKSGNIILSPAKYINYRSYAFEEFLSNEISFENVSGINSGLLVKTSFFNEIGGYNESLFLDFCDHDFLLKAKKHLTKLEIIDVVLHQNFSSFSHEKAQAMQRYKIYLKDLRAFGIGRNKFYIWLNSDIRRLISLSFKYRSMDFFLYRIRN